MSNTSQKRAIQNYRNRLHKRGMARFEVLGLDADRDLIRSLARRLAEDGPDASRLRSAVSQTIGGEPPRKGSILEALRRLMEGRTTLLIAHRLSTVRHADRIIVLKAGRVVETGTHDQLLALRGCYAHLHNLQFDSGKQVAGPAR